MSELPGEDLPQASNEDAENGKRKKSTEKPMSKRGSGKARRNTKVDARVKLERSRQSARECRARKKLRYQYLEELVTNREKAVLALRDEVETYKKWCEEADNGDIPASLRKLLEQGATRSDIDFSRLVKEELEGIPEEGEEGMYEDTLPSDPTLVPTVVSLLDEDSDSDSV